MSRKAAHRGRIKSREKCEYVYDPEYKASTEGKKAREWILESIERGEMFCAMRPTTPHHRGETVNDKTPMGERASAELLARIATLEADNERLTIRSETRTKVLRYVLHVLIGESEPENGDIGDAVQLAADATAARLTRLEAIERAAFAFANDPKSAVKLGDLLVALSVVEPSTPPPSNDEEPGGMPPENW